MKFLFSLFNHSRFGQENLLDAVFIIGHQLMALGHEFIFDPQNPGYFLGKEQGYNIIIENFSETNILATISNVHMQGGRFIVVAMEEPTEGEGFNNSTSPEMIFRKQHFRLCKPYIDGVLHIVPGEHTFNWYSQYAPSACMELGYAPTLVRELPYLEPAYDFGFFGTIHGRRNKILKDLDKRIGHSKGLLAIGSFPSPQIRDEEMRNVKVILNIRKRDNLGLISGCRCNTALCLGRPIVSEPYSNETPWDDIVSISKSDDSFIDEAIYVLSNWDFFHKKQFDLFKSKLTPEFCIGEPLRKIGVMQ
jgi:hypothetical protein